MGRDFRISLITLHVFDCNRKLCKDLCKFGLFGGSALRPVCGHSVAIGDPRKRSFSCLSVRQVFASLGYARTMSIEGHRFYPGEKATAQQLMSLAGEYRRSAEALLAIGRNGAPLSWAPYRLVAIHSIELYLNAYLIAAGHSQASVRGLQHSTASRAQLATVGNLRLRKRTVAHLQHLTDNREYLVTRYDPAPISISQLNRLQATMTEVAQKVAGVVQAMPT